jgi:microcystin-dependent protein
MGTGNDIGSWGTNTNNNLQVVLENAIAGYQAVSITSASQALVANNSSTIDQARAALLKITGSTGTATLYAPPVSKQYVIYNTLSGNLTISNATANNGTTATGGSTVLIPTGTIATIWSDGTNFFAQNTFLPGTVSLGNPLAASSGGTGEAGTVTGVPYANGTSSYTQATAAQIVSAIGTTAVTNATNATTATTAINLSTTLAIAGGGTGATTAAGALTNLGVVSASLQAVYPVGSIYMNASNSASPATLFGFGTWSALAPGQMLLGNGSGYTAGATGGTASIALSTANLPSHSHAASGLSASSSSSSTSSTSVSINGNTTGIGLNYPVGQAPGGGGTRYYGAYTGLPDANAYLSDPGHSHSASASTTTSTSTSTTISGNTAAVGSGTSITTISPYLVVYMWQRTA